MLMRLAIKLFGKKLIDGGIEKIGLSKTKLTAIVGGLILISQYVLPAFGVNVVIPTELKELLAAAGLWTLADKFDSKPA